jgi:hypothetical protein
MYSFCANCRFICPLRSYICKAVNIMLAGRSHFCPSVRAWHNFLCTFPLATGNAALCTVPADRRIAWHRSVPAGISLTKSTLKMRNVLSMRRSWHTEGLQMEIKFIGLCPVTGTDSWQLLLLSLLVKRTLILGSGLLNFCLKTWKKTVICRRRAWEENTECH